MRDGIIRRTALLLFCVVIAILIFLFGRDVGISSAPNAVTAEHYSQQYAGHTKERIESECGSLEPADLRDCVEEIVEASRESQRGEHDLTTQQSMAKWTFWMFLASMGGLAISGVALLALLSSLDQTKTAIRDNRELGERELRAYVLLQGIEVEEIKSGQVNSSYRVFVTWKNSGQTPASAVRCDINHLGIIGLFPDNFDFAASPDWRERRGTVGPGESTRDISRLIPSWDLALPKIGGAMLYVWGWIEYSDVFKGSPRRRSEFCVWLEVTENVKGDLVFRPHTETSHNGCDEDCMKQPTTSA